MANIHIPMGASIGGLQDKLDLINKAIDLIHQAEGLLEQANRVTLEVFLEESAEDSGS